MDVFSSENSPKKTATSDLWTEWIDEKTSSEADNAWFYQELEEISKTLDKMRKDEGTIVGAGLETELQCSPRRLHSPPHSSPRRPPPRANDTSSSNSGSNNSNTPSNSVTRQNVRARYLSLDSSRGTLSPFDSKSEDSSEDRLREVDRGLDDDHCSLSSGYLSPMRGGERRASAPRTSPPPTPLRSRVRQVTASLRQQDPALSPSCRLIWPVYRGEGTDLDNSRRHTGTSDSRGSIDRGSERWQGLSSSTEGERRRVERYAARYGVVDDGDIHGPSPQSPIMRAQQQQQQQQQQQHATVGQRRSAPRPLPRGDRSNSSRCYWNEASDSNDIGLEDRRGSRRSHNTHRSSRHSSRHSSRCHRDFDTTHPQGGLRRRGSKASRGRSRSSSSSSSSSEDGVGCAPAEEQLLQLELNQAGGGFAPALIRALRKDEDRFAQCARDAAASLAVYQRRLHSAGLPGGWNSSTPQLRPLEAYVEEARAGRATDPVVDAGLILDALRRQQQKKPRHHHPRLRDRRRRS